MEVIVKKFQFENVEELLNRLSEALSSELKKQYENNEPEEQEEFRKMPPTNIDYYIKRIEKRTGIKAKSIYKSLNTLVEIYPPAVFTMILKEIAIELDKLHPGHISDSEEIYVVSMLDGCAHKVNKDSIVNYKNFAAFRTIEDIKYACEILKEPLKQMFNNGEQED